MTKQDLMDAIKRKHGSIARFAFNENLQREIAYQAIDGRGSVNARLKIARLVKRKPSDIWPERGQLVNSRDDAMFNVADWQIYAM